MDIKELLKLTESECLGEWGDSAAWERVTGSQTEGEYIASLTPELVSELIRDSIALRAMAENQLSVEICSECKDVTVRYQHSEVLAEVSMFENNKLEAVRAAIAIATLKAKKLKLV